jgi:hypothetical protein
LSPGLRPFAYLFTDQEDSFALRRNSIDEEFGPDVVHIGDKDRVVLWCGVMGIEKLGHLEKVKDSLKYKSIDTHASRNLFQCWCTYFGLGVFRLFICSFKI